MVMTNKIQPHHLRLKAMIYIRQSTARQVVENTASGERQRDLVEVAAAFGYAKEQITLIDADQGKTGTSMKNRDGFRDLLSAVAKKEVGIVICSEVSRLARTSRDFLLLLDQCICNGTLIAADTEVFDPRVEGDRIILTFKAIFSEVEVRAMKKRMGDAKNTRVARNQLRVRLPTGYVRNTEGQVIKDPDPQVREAIERVFLQYAQGSSIGYVLRYFREHKLSFPTRVYKKGQESNITYAPLTRDRVYEILLNPCYAGSFVYGRTLTREESDPNNYYFFDKRIKDVKPEDWKKNIPGAHEAYISLEQFWKNRETLAGSGFDFKKSRNSIREGKGQLQGIILCGRCGRRMSAVSTTMGGKPYIYYNCSQAYSNNAAPFCQSVSGTILDRAIVDILLNQLAPAEIERTLSVLGELEEQTLRVQEQLQHRLKEAQKEAELVRRRFEKVDPENDYVFRTVEQELQEKGKVIEAMELEIRKQTSQPQMISAEQLAAVRALATEVPKFWQASTTSNEERKMILRTFIKDVTVTNVPGATRGLGTYKVFIRWCDDTCTEVNLSNKNTTNHVRVSPQLIAQIQELVPRYSDEEIVEILKQKNVLTPRGKHFTRASLEGFRWRYHIRRRPKTNP